jgi:hypothetical protein
VRFRALISVVVLLALPFGGAPAARAAGTGGIEISPYPGVVDGHQVTAFHVSVPAHGHATVRYVMRNTTGHPVAGKVYAAAATRGTGGQFAIGGPGSAPKVHFAGGDVTLPANAVRPGTFTIDGPVDTGTFSAVVVEVHQGAVNERAATLIYLTSAHGTFRRLLTIVLVAVPEVLLALAVLMVLRRRRRTTGPS